MRINLLKNENIRKGIIKNENEIHSNIVATMMQNRSSILKSGTKNIFLIELANSFSHELHKTVFWNKRNSGNSKLES